MDFLAISPALGIVAGIVQVSGYIFYTKKINVGRIRPNTASWSIWAFGAVLESTSYVYVTGDWVKNVLPIACAVSAIFMFLYCLRYGYFGRPSYLEWFLVYLDCFAIFLWWWYDSAIYANLFLVLTAVISFIPIIIHVWKDQMAEDSLPWFTWTTAYALLGLVVILRWEKWEDLVYPAVFLILHLVVAVLALDRRKPGQLAFS